ncbi:hypothetical protein WDV93_12115 [Pantoea ananatis]
MKRRSPVWMLCMTLMSHADHTVRGNAELCRRGIENVLRNALRFSLPGQRIHVSLKVESQWLAIHVRDRVRVWKKPNFPVSLTRLYA